MQLCIQAWCKRAEIALQNKAESGRHSWKVDPGCGVTKRKKRNRGEMASHFSSSGRQVSGCKKVESGMGKSFPGEGGKEQACLTQLLLQLPGSGSIPASLQPSSPCSVGHGAGGNPAALPGPTAAPRPGTSDTGKISAPDTGSAWW